MERELTKVWNKIQDDHECLIKDNIDVRAIGSKAEKEIRKQLEKNKGTIYKILSRVKELAKTEIQNSKDVIKYIGSQPDDWYETIIDVHEREKYEHEHKEEIITKNIKMIFDENRDDIQVYFASIKEIPESLGVVVARNESQARDMFFASDYIFDIVKKMREIAKKEKPDSKSFDINIDVGKIKEDKIDCICDCICDKEFAHTFLQNETFGLQILSDSELTIEKVDRILTRFDNFEGTLGKEQGDVVTNLVDNPFIQCRVMKDITMTEMLQHEILK